MHLILDSLRQSASTFHDKKLGDVDAAQAQTVAERRDDGQNFVRARCALCNDNCDGRSTTIRMAGLVGWLRCRSAALSVAAEAAGRFDGGDVVEIEIDDCLEGFAGCAVAAGLWDCVEPLSGARAARADRLFRPALRGSGAGLSGDTRRSGDPVAAGRPPGPAARADLPRRARPH